MSLLDLLIRIGIGGGKCPPISMVMPRVENTTLTTPSSGSLNRKALRFFASLADESLDGLLLSGDKSKVGVDTKAVPSRLLSKNRLMAAKAHQAPKMKKKVPGAACPMNDPMAQRGCWARTGVNYCISEEGTNTMKED